MYKRIAPTLQHRVKLIHGTRINSDGILALKRLFLDCRLVSIVLLLQILVGPRVTSRIFALDVEMVVQ